MRRELPLFLTAVIGIFMIMSFFVPHQWVSVPADFLQQCAVIVVAFGYVLGGANLLRVSLDGISRRERDMCARSLLILREIQPECGRSWRRESRPNCRAKQARDRAARALRCRSAR